MSAIRLRTRTQVGLTLLAFVLSRRYTKTVVCPGTVTLLV